MTFSDVLPVPLPQSNKQLLKSLGEAHEALSPAKLRATAQDLLTTLLRVRMRARSATTPRVAIRLSVYRPDGRSAVTIRFGAGH
ncbi:MAG: hypothetical protein J0H41_14800 [Rhizobiales bacterium]|nr:hypothetical protein [Hyphomicrobiales bacterium]